jgi:hypothetical protein
MKRIWHHYLTWEDYQNGMYRKVTTDERRELLKVAIEFTGDAKRYGAAMSKVLEAMPQSCEHNLTAPGNKRAWIGHAACALAIQCPEDIVREAWGHLTPEQQIAADAEAQFYIDYWRMEYESKNS